jgi:hypothetical protein
MLLDLHDKNRGVVFVFAFLEYAFWIVTLFFESKENILARVEKQR